MLIFAKMFQLSLMTLFCQSLKGIFFGCYRVKFFLKLVSEWDQFVSYELVFQMFKKHIQYIVILLFDYFFDVPLLFAGLDVKILRLLVRTGFVKG